MEDLKYPIGKYIPKEYTDAQLQEWINEIKLLPSVLEEAILNLDEAQMNTSYRPDGWTIRQVVHHLADSHANAYFRFKLALTEDNPVIKPYDEAAWAELADYKNLPENISTTMLQAVHIRWVEILKNMTREDWNRTFFHPEHQRTMTLWFILGMYVWHGKHHVAHITNLRARNNW